MDFSNLFGAETYDKYSEIEECDSNIVTIPHPEFASVVIGHYALLFWSVCALVAMLFMVLRVEVLKCPRKRKRTRVGDSVSVRKPPTSAFPAPHAVTALIEMTH